MVHPLWTNCSLGTRQVGCELEGLAVSAVSALQECKHGVQTPAKITAHAKRALTSTNSSNIYTTHGLLHEATPTNYANLCEAYSVYLHIPSVLCTDMYRCRQTDTHTHTHTRTLNILLTNTYTQYTTH